MALVRDEGKAIQLKSSFPTINTIIGDLSSLSLIEEASRDAGIVISKLLPHSYQLSSTQHFYTADISLSLLLFHISHTLSASLLSCHLFLCGLASGYNG